MTDDVNAMKAEPQVIDHAARFLVDVCLNWRAYACIRCSERMAGPSSLLCGDCEKAVAA